MDTVELSSLLKETTYLVNTFIGQNPLDYEANIGLGAGVAINSEGYLITAAHNITGPTKILEPPAKDEITLAKTVQGEFIQYIPIMRGIGVKNTFMIKPIIIDLTILRPYTPRKNVLYLPISTDSVKVGTRVLMAGFPDEMRLPFYFDKTLDKNNPEVKAVLPSIPATSNLLMLKSGMVGNSTTFAFTDSEQRTLDGEIFYVDNQSNYGASGGPVVNLDGEVIGIVLQRAETDIPHNPSEKALDLKVPSGSTVALSPRTIQSYLANAVKNPSTEQKN